jgi:hypothetical protein
MDCRLRLSPSGERRGDPSATAALFRISAMFVARLLPAVRDSIRESRKGVVSFPLIPRFSASSRALAIQGSISFRGISYSRGTD